MWNDANKFKIKVSKLGILMYGLNFALASTEKTMYDKK